MITQILKIVDAVSMATGAFSSTVRFEPHMTHDDSGVVVVKISQESANAVSRPSSASYIDLQGSLDGSTWVVVARLDMNSAMTVPDFNAPTPVALGSNGGSITSSAVIQLFPYFRVKYPVLANATINAWLMER